MILKTELLEEVTDELFVSAPNIRYDKQEPLPFDTTQARVFFVVPPANPISFLYKTCQELRSKGKITEFGLEFTSLEEVFLTVAQLVEPPEEAEADILKL